MKKNDLSRFVLAQQKYYNLALNEIINGRKVSHWMWYIFPQIAGLGKSSTSQYYAIKDLKEAIEYLENSYLKNNLVEICQALMKLKTNNVTEIFGKPDDMKLKSSMTLFSYASKTYSVFDEVLVKYFDGKVDKRTKRILDL